MQLLKKLMASLVVFTLASSTITIKASYLDNPSWHKMHKDIHDALVRGTDANQINFLLSMGADVNYVHQGTPLLITAVKSLIKNPNDSYFIVKMFLDKGANPNAQDKMGDTALHWVIRLANNEEAEKFCSMLITALELKGAQPFIVNHKGQSAYDLLRKLVQSKNVSPDLKAIEARWSEEFAGPTR